VFERYAEPARRAVYFARLFALVEHAPGIDTVHLLNALMNDSNSRANTILNLREYFPICCYLPWRYASKDLIPDRDVPLDYLARSVYRKTDREGRAMGDYWIDTEHLLLGILAEKGCPGERYLAQAGITLENARRLIIENKASRPDYGPVPAGWDKQSSWQRLISKWKSRTRARAAT